MRKQIFLAIADLCTFVAPAGIILFFVANSNNVWFLFGGMSAFLVILVLLIRDLNEEQREDEEVHNDQISHTHEDGRI